MSRTSRTPMVILGLLSVEPMSGYDLKATIDRSIGHFWSESYGQIYPALKALHEQGLVERTERSAGDRKRQVYHLTEAGRRTLDAWLSTSPEPRYVRNELLLRVFFGHHTPRGTLRAHLTRELHEARGTAAGMAGVSQELRETLKDNPELPYWLLTLDLGRRTAQARAEWAAHALESLTEEDL